MKTGIECTGCDKGVLMCKNRPCLGTPEEFEAIIDAGFAHKLRLDFWAGRASITPEELEEYKGTPLEALVNLAYEYQVANPNPFTEDVWWLSGGTENDVNFKTQYSPSGTCAFLTPEEKCELHTLGLKPEQGRTSCCIDEKDQAGDTNLEYAHIWDTPKGREVLEKFKKTVGI